MKLSTALAKLLYTTIRIETRSADGDYVDGTGFIYEYATADNTYPFLITAKHIIKDAAEGRITLLQGQNRLPSIGKGYTLDIDSFSKLWFNHPDEQLNVSVTPFVPFVKHVENSGISIYFQSLNSHSVADAATQEAIEPGDDAIYVGYPHNCWDRKNLLPVFRQGIIAFPFTADYQGQRQSIIDSSVLPGSAGSPVFRKTSDANASLDGCLIGVLSNLAEPLSQENGEKPGNKAHDPTLETPMGSVIRIDAAVEAIVAYLKEKGFI